MPDTTIFGDTLSYSPLYGKKRKSNTDGHDHYTIDYSKHISFCFTFTGIFHVFHFSNPPLPHYLYLYALQIGNAFLCFSSTFVTTITVNNKHAHLHQNILLIQQNQE